MEESMEDDFDKYNIQTQKLLDSYCDAAKDLKFDEERDDLLQFLMVDFDNALDSTLRDFYKKVAMNMNEAGDYTLYIKMQKRNAVLSDKFVEIARPLMNMWDKNDPRNMIKRRGLGVKEGTTMKEVGYMLGNYKYDKITAECEKNIDASFHK